MTDLIYLDHAATTPLDPRVAEAMMPFLTTEFGNPSSVHQLGRRARYVVEECRERIAAIINARPAEIVFTSGGTEANNLALRGGSGRGTLVTSHAEHEAVLRTAEDLLSAGRDVVILQPDAEGVISDQLLANGLPDGTTLVSLMHANNETGVLTDVRSLASLAHRQGARFHTDAVQTAGVFVLDADELGVDLFSASAHKFYGPKGVGFLYVRGGLELQPQITGGSQERRRRGGTENIASIVGMTEALSIARDERQSRLDHALELRALLIDALDSTFGSTFHMNTPRDPQKAVPGIINITFPPADGRPVDGEMLLLNLDMEGVLASAGSACTSGALEPSHVLRAMGIPEDTARASVRISTGANTSRDDIERAVDVLGRVVARMRGVPA